MHHGSHFNVSNPQEPLIASDYKKQLLIKAAAWPYETVLMHFLAESFVQGIFGVY